MASYDVNIALSEKLTALFRNDLRRAFELFRFLAVTPRSRDSKRGGGRVFTPHPPHHHVLENPDRLQSAG